MNYKKNTAILLLIIITISLFAVCANYFYSLDCLTDYIKHNYFNGIAKLYDPEDKLCGFCTVIYILPVISTVVSFALLRLLLKLKTGNCLLFSMLVFVICAVAVVFSVVLYSCNYSSYCNTVVAASSASWNAEMQEQYIQDNSPANEVIVETF